MKENISTAQGQAQGGKLKFRPFNSYENWARLLWGFTTGVGGEYGKLGYEPVEGEKLVHLVHKNYKTQSETSIS